MYIKVYLISFNTKVLCMSRAHSNMRMYISMYDDSKINIVIYTCIVDLNLSINSWTGIEVNVYLFCMSI